MNTTLILITSVMCQFAAAVLANTPAVIYAKDMNGRYILANRHYADAIHRGDDAQAYELLHQLVGAGGIHGRMDISNEASRLLPLAKDGILRANPRELDELRRLTSPAEPNGAIPQQP